MLRPSRRGGFTLIELLVVIAIIAILIGLLLPAVQKVREAANRMRCQNHIKQIALAVHNYHGAYQVFPYATLDIQAGETVASYVTGHILILPFLEQDALARRWDPKKPRNDSSTEATLGYSNSSLQKQLIPTFLCPSMVAPSGPLPEERGYCSYLFVAGTPSVSDFHYVVPDPAYDGVIVPLKQSASSPNRAPTRFASLMDGASNTFMVGETDFKPQGVASTSMGGVWGYGYIGYAWGTTFVPFNKHDNAGTAYGSFRSEHTGGASFAFADGSVRFMQQSITTDLYRSLATRAGGEPVSPD